MADADEGNVIVAVLAGEGKGGHRAYVVSCVNTVFTSIDDKFLYFHRLFTPRRGPSLPAVWIIQPKFGLYHLSLIRHQFRSRPLLIIDR